jgi:tetrahydromethanopterin S-methyltransferase subunit A
MEIEKLRYDHEIVSKAKLTDIESIRAKLEQQKKEQRALENHFKMVDLNNAMKLQEEEQLRKVAALEDIAKVLLDDGAIALQKVWRGSKDRKLVATMKSKQSKKGGKSKKRK